MIDKRGIREPTITELRRSIDSLMNFALVTRNPDLQTIVLCVSKEVDSEITGSVKQTKLPSLFK